MTTKFCEKVWTLLQLRLKHLMSMTPEHDVPNVVTEFLLRHLVEAGYDIEISAQIDAYRKSAVWYGEWTISAVLVETGKKKILVPTRNKASEIHEIGIRIFKTSNGLISFLHSLEYKSVEIPLYAGGNILQKKLPQK